METMEHSESEENYLKTIVVLSKKNPVVRSVDIAKELGYKRPSVSVALKNMKEKDYVSVSDKGFISLTEKGKTIAQRIYERHMFFSKWFINLGVDQETAEKEACGIEHVLSDKTFEAVKNFVVGLEMGNPEVI